MTTLEQALAKFDKMIKELEIENNKLLQLIALTPEQRRKMIRRVK